MTTLFKDSDHIYFIGIGGISMSGLAEILASSGHQVSGTDLRETPVTKHLESIGIQVNYGHQTLPTTLPMWYLLRQFMRITRSLRRRRKKS